MHIHGTHFLLLKVGYGGYHAENGSITTMNPDIPCTDPNVVLGTIAQFNPFFILSPVALAFNGPIPVGLAAMCPDFSKIHPGETRSTSLLGDTSQYGGSRGLARKDIRNTEKKHDLPQ
jgi:hypothetical protein